jgi:Fe-S-cluster containining protein
MTQADRMISNTEPIRSCIRCGTCCEKGGPAFHTDDKQLIQDGIIPSRHLYTIRKNEPVYENVKGYILPAPSDIIKIKDKPGSSTCIFFDEKSRNCNIYKNRPIECRLLQCWNTRDIEKQYAINRLTRKDLLSDMDDIWKLVCDHQKRCDYAGINHLLKPGVNTLPKTAPPAVKEMMRYDFHLRNLLAEKGGIDPDIMDFLFGKPLQETLSRYGIRIMD